jgi:succinate dehydrogenase flavoprotein subunit
VFGQRAGEYGAEYARKTTAVRIDSGAVERAVKEALAPFELGPSGENPYKVQQELQDTMQDLVGIVRTESEMREALTRLRGFTERAARVAVAGHREYNGGWHTAVDLPNLLTVAEAITVSALERKESRGGHFRTDYPDKSAEFGNINVMVKASPDGIQVSRVPIPDMPAELKQVIEEQKQ